MSKKLIGACVGLAMVGMAGAASGAVFEYESTCVGNCANFGLTDLDTLKGTISFSDASVFSNSSLDTSDVVSFSFLFGTFEIDSTGVASFYFDGILNASASSFSSFSFVASDALDSGSAETFFFLKNDATFPADQGRFGPGRCNVSCSPSSVGTFPGAATLSHESSLTLVPAPAALPLMGTALAGLGVIGWRRKAV